MCRCPGVQVCKCPEIKVFFLDGEDQGSVSLLVSAPDSIQMPGLSHHFGQGRCGTVDAHRSASNARAVAHSNMALHLRVHADRARPHKRSETPRVLAQAKSLRNWAVSVEKRPPTSSEHDKPCPPTSASEFGVRGFLVSSGVLPSDLVHLVCPGSGSTVAADGTHEYRVHCQQGAIAHLQHPGPTHVGTRLSAPFHLLHDRCGPLQSPEDISCASGSQQLSMPSGGGPSCR